MGMATLARQMIAAGTGGANIAGKLDAGVEQPLNIVRAALDDLPHDGLITEPIASLEGILHMRVDGVGGVEDRRDAALSIEGVPFLEFAFRDHGDRQVGVSRSARLRPAAPLPMMRTSWYRASC